MNGSTSLRKLQAIRTRGQTLSVLPRLLSCAVLGFASLSLTCRSLTADTAKGGHVAPAPVTPAAKGSPPSAERPSAFVIAESIYDGGLASGWQDWGWGPHDLTQGAARLNFSKYGGWILHHDAFANRFGAFVFRMRAQAPSEQFLEVRLANGEGDQSFPAVDVTANFRRAARDGWSEYYLPWEVLNPGAGQFDRITLRAKSELSAVPVLFDKLLFTKFDPVAARAALARAPVKRVKLTVECNQGRAISPYIYGIAGDAGDLGATSRRWGGNRTTRYNWQNGATNVGKDWYFENTTAEGYEEYLENSRKQSVTTALTVPTIGWVSKDDHAVGFPLSIYGPQRGHDQYKPDAGDGVRPDGKEIAPKAPTLTSVIAPPEMIGRWVGAIAEQDRKRNKRSVQQYILDNEPSLWSVNHRDVHPDPVSYDELLERSISYGSAIRAADPHALIAGPAEWGWTAYFYSARDSALGFTLRPDRRAHGDQPLVPWYLQKLKEHDAATGIKVLDVLDLHFYPQAQGVYGKGSDPNTAALRLRSTRSLWDPTYKDESWINDTVRLIPRMKEWVNQNYPGLATSIGEYNFGGEDHISGGLALAEALGRFGTEGLDFAYYWGEPPHNSPVYWAFRAYRNFDGKGAHFLDRSLDTHTEGEISLFASRDQSGKHLVLIALNLNPGSAAQASIGLNGCASLASRRRFSYDSLSSAIADEGASQAGVLDETLPPYSITVFDVVLK